MPSIFRDDATGTIYGVSCSTNYGDTKFEWIRRTADGKATVAPLPYGDKPEFPQASLLYGSMTKDAQGRFYVVGTMNHKPVILQITAR